MISAKLFLALGFTLAASATALAADEQSSGSMPGVKPSENVKLVPGSMAKRGPQARFDVVVDSGADQSRRIQYAVDCEQGKIAVAAIVNKGQEQQMAETEVTPPRTAEWSKPADGSKAAQWASQACHG
ncbi:MAG: hypothetical protein ABI885_16910 [Gammaproteobacteria bacterium]